jgi:predicted peroxiredoxin
MQGSQSGAKLCTCREKVEMMDLKPEDLIDMIKEA